jgi:hypothetical protein
MMAMRRDKFQKDNEQQNTANKRKGPKESSAAKHLKKLKHELLCTHCDE